MFFSEGFADISKHHQQLHRDIYQPFVPWRINSINSKAVMWSVFSWQLLATKGTKWPWPEKKSVILMEAHCLLHFYTDLLVKSHEPVGRS